MSSNSLALVSSLDGGEEATIKFSISLAGLMLPSLTMSDPPLGEGDHWSLLGVAGDSEPAEQGEGGSLLIAKGLSGRAEYTEAIREEDAMDVESLTMLLYLSLLSESPSSGSIGLISMTLSSFTGLMSITTGCW